VHSHPSFPADNAFSMNKKTPSRRYAMRPIVNMLEEDRATDTGNMQKNWQRSRVWFWRYPRGQTDKQNHRQTYSSQYFATAPADEEIKYPHTTVWWDNNRSTTIQSIRTLFEYSELEYSTPVFSKESRPCTQRAQLSAAKIVLHSVVES